MAADPVEIVFQVGGIADVQSAFKTLDQILARFERTQKSGGERAVGGAKREARGIVDAHVREWERWKTSVERIRRNSATMAGREAVRAAREEKRALESTTVAAQRAADKEIAQAHRKAEAKVRAEQSAYARSTRALETYAAKQSRILEKQTRDEKRAADEVAAKRIAARGKIDASMGRVAGVASGAMGRVGRTAVNLGSAALALGGGFSLADSVSRATAAERAAIATSTSGYIKGKAGPAGTRVDPALIAARAREVQGATGIDKLELLEGLQSYTAKSSDLHGGMANMQEMAVLAKSQGAKFGDVMSAAGQIKTQNEGISEEDLLSMMRNIVAQGKLGAVELTDLARVAGKITATSGMYQGSQTETQRSLLGLSQIAIKTSQSPEEAGTVISRLGSDALKSKDKLKKLGVVDPTTGEIAQAPELISKVMAHAGGNIGKISDMGFGVESIRLFEALAPKFREAEANAKGSGGQAVRDEILKFTGASASKEDIQEDFKAARAGKGEQLDHAFSELREKIETHMLPHLSRFADKLPELIPKVERVIDSLAKFADWFVENPIGGLGALVLGSVAKDLAGAAIGAGIKSILTSMLVGATGGAPNVVAGTAAALGPKSLAAGGMLGAGGAVVGAGALGMAVGYGISEIATAQQLDAQRSVAAAGAGAMTGAGGPVTAENLAQKKMAAAKLAIELQKEREAKADQEGIGKMWFRDLAHIGGALGHKEAKEYDAATTGAAKAQQRSIDTTEEALKKLSAAIVDAEKRITASGASVPSPASPGLPIRNGSSFIDPSGGSGHK